LPHWYPYLLDIRIDKNAIYQTKILEQHLSNLKKLKLRHLAENHCDLGIEA
jgi:hypothetical protein